MLVVGLVAVFAAWSLDARGAALDGPAKGGGRPGSAVIVRNNFASDIQAFGAGASLAFGAASLRAPGRVAANGVVSVASVLQRSQISLTENRARDVSALGGEVLVNSVSLQDSDAGRSRVTLTRNVARGVAAEGGSVRSGVGGIGRYERDGLALANALRLAQQSVLQETDIAIEDNRARDVAGSGGLAAAGSVLASRSRIDSRRILIAGNRVGNLRAEGRSGSVGGGSVLSFQQSAMAMASSLAVFDSTLDARSVLVTGNVARDLSAQGGTLVVNGVSIERGAGSASGLSAAVEISDNVASEVSTYASEHSALAGVKRGGSAARAAAHAVVLHDGATVDAASAITLTGNRSSRISAVGGTALASALAAYRGARVAGSSITLAGNRIEDASTGGARDEAAGIGRARNGILVANGVYLDGGEQGAVSLSNSPLRILGNAARALHAEGGRINVNALAVNADGSMAEAPVLIAGNRAEAVGSEGSETTLAGKSVSRGVGHANANAVQVLGTLRAGSVALVGNTASRVSASKGLALANSLLLDEGATSEDVSIDIVANQATGVEARDGHAATANSVHNAGRIAGSSVRVSLNRGSAQASSGDAIVNGLRNHKGGSVKNSGIVVLGNQGSVSNAGIANSVVNSGAISASQILIAGNIGAARDGGVVNSMLNSASGTVNRARIAIVGNRGQAQRGIVNSIDNRGSLTGEVVIAGNRGLAEGGGTVNSLVNHGQMSGRVLIAGNQARASAGTIVNSVINRGSISGSVNIIGN